MSFNQSIGRGYLNSYNAKCMASTYILYKVAEFFGRETGIDSYRKTWL